MSDHLVLRLEQALNLWEDFLFVEQLAVRSLQAHGQKSPHQLTGALVSFDQFRGALLKKALHEPFDWNRWCTPASLHIYGEYFLSLPMHLWQWTKHSRRVFTLSNDLITQLLATSLERMTYADITLPFDSFAIVLERPLQISFIEHGGEKSPTNFDLIIVSVLRKAGSNPQIEILIVPAHVARRRRVSAWEKQKAQQAAKRNDWVACKKYVDSFEDSLEYRHCFNGTGCPITSSVRILDTISLLEKDERLRGLTAEEVDESKRFFSGILRIVAGLCFYLESLPGGSPHRSDWTPLPRSCRPDPRAITNAASICSVSSTHKLTPEEARVFEEVIGNNTGYELCAHFRRGHWRKRPGKGNDPDAPKIVHVRPTLVRKDRLTEGIIPGGASSKPS